MYRNNNSLTTSRVIGIQFSIQSPEDILRGSVVEVTTKDTYNGERPVVCGLFDPRMGVIESGFTCPTDGLNYMTCPGYFGHIQLENPVFYTQYIQHLIKVLKLVCYRCSKLLINKKKYQFISGWDNERRWRYVNTICGTQNTTRRCGATTEDGCGCLQPTIKKEDQSRIFAEWKDDAKSDGVPTAPAAPEKPKVIRIRLTAEMVLKICKRISDEDVQFMGMSPKFSRPEWMICTVFAVPPPAVRPSVKYDQQRSEDDLTTFLSEIIRYNKLLKDKKGEDMNALNAIELYESMVQYFVGSIMEQKVQSSVTQNRTSRPMKPIKERLNGKTGRLRSNLMAKRVDFSARSVITADPNISIRELGIPLRIARNITKPVVVNHRNRMYLMSLVINGDDVSPGAKMVEQFDGGDSNQREGKTILLRRISEDMRRNIILKNGDIVHRHMMDGDAILFNRQPSLHRMSMMSHVAKIMKQGDTFRMNVADTKPYNADFDGDEMNLHMPQDVESEIELMNLVAVPYQIVSPGNSQPIVGIYQDSMLGSYIFTTDGDSAENQLPIREVMNLLMSFDKVDLKKLGLEKSTKTISPYKLIEQILPPMTILKSKDNEIEIANGRYIKGKLDKKSLGGDGIIQRICNYYGNMAASNFIDDLQNIITKYLVTKSFSVGISDLILNSSTLIDTRDESKGKVLAARETAKKVFEDILFSKKSADEEETFLRGKSKYDIFEQNMNTSLDAMFGSYGLKNLGESNRFKIMADSGSKGANINIQQMMFSLGQQKLDGRRIPYGFDNRTLPHFTKYDDSATARGFVDSSYIEGLKPHELFFHAMGGRVGLIDTAVKTSKTGYIQRQLTKGLEDIMVNYDMTLRTSLGKVIQFRYGGDSVEPMKDMKVHNFALLIMSTQQIYDWFLLYIAQPSPEIKKQVDDYNQLSSSYIQFLLSSRDDMLKYMFKYSKDTGMYCHVPFDQIIKEVIGQQLPDDTFTYPLTRMLSIVTDTFTQLETTLYYAKPSRLFKTLYFYYLSPKQLLYTYKMNANSFEKLMGKVVLMYKQAIISPGEMVGIVAAQSIGEPTTQMTLNTFHFAGVGTKSNVSLGVPRITEILSLTETNKLISPSLSIYIKDPYEEYVRDTDKDKPQAPELKERYLQNRNIAMDVICDIKLVKMREIVRRIDICYSPGQTNAETADFKEFLKRLNASQNPSAGAGAAGTTDDSPTWVLKMVMNEEAMHDNHITMEDINYILNKVYSNGEIKPPLYTDMNSSMAICIIEPSIFQKLDKSKAAKQVILDQTDEIYKMQNLQNDILSITVQGIDGISSVNLREIDIMKNKSGNKYEAQGIFVLDTVGTNLESVLGLNHPKIDNSRTTSNSIMEIMEIFGIEAARQTIYNELKDVMEYDKGFINNRHYEVLCDRMAYNAKLFSMNRHGINQDNIGPIAKASFEETTEMFLKAARHGELDKMRGVSSNIMCGQEGQYGTNSFQVFLDMKLFSGGDAVHSKSRARAPRKHQARAEVQIIECEDKPSVVIEEKNIQVVEHDTISESVFGF
jgi:DNA-directed RNA polymerase II subunit RPB1